MRLFASCLLLLILSPAITAAAEYSNAQVDELIGVARQWPGVLRFDYGVTARGTMIPALITSDDLDLFTTKTRITLIESQSNSDQEQVALHVMNWFYTSDEAGEYRKRFALSAVPLADPDGGDAKFGGWPPGGNYYSDQDHLQAQYLWRWLGMHAPDLVIAIGSGEEPATIVPAGRLPQLQQIPADSKLKADVDLVSQLVAGKPSGVDLIAAIQMIADGEQCIERLRTIMDANVSGPSPARLELQRRLDRSPLEVARELSEYYGDRLNSVVYTQSVALLGRLRLGELTNDPKQRAEVERIVLPYLRGDKQALPERISASHMSGHLIFAELARQDGEAGYLSLARSAADLGFEADGKPKKSMPYHSEMSDSVFMACPILVQAGRLTGESKYYDLALEHFRFMQGHCLREDGLYRHSPLAEAAWGRGNGFPALGVALCLSDLPPEHDAHAAMLTEFDRHMIALARHQDATGMWHQVIDHAGSYRELTCTCMITYAMLRGIRRGWLDAETYAPRVQRAWQAIRLRVGPEGNLVDVCTGTGKQKSLQDYLDRTAILGRDERGGAMALWVATEMEAYLREQPVRNDLPELR